MRASSKIMMDGNENLLENDDSSEQIVKKHVSNENDPFEDCVDFMAEMKKPENDTSFENLNRKSTHQKSKEDQYYRTQSPMSLPFVSFPTGMHFGQDPSNNELQLNESRRQSDQYIHR